MNVLVPLILFLAGPQCDRYILKVFKKKKKWFPGWCEESLKKKTEGEKRKEKGRKKKKRKAGKRESD